MKTFEVFSYRSRDERRYRCMSDEELVEERARLFDKWCWDNDDEVLQDRIQLIDQIIHENETCTVTSGNITLSSGKGIGGDASGGQITICS